MKGLRSLGSNSWPVGDKVSSFTTTRQRHHFPIFLTVKISNKRAADISPCPATALTSSKYLNSVNKLSFQKISKSFSSYRADTNILQKSLKKFSVFKGSSPEVGSIVKVYERKEGQLSVSAEMISNLWISPSGKVSGLKKTKVVLTGLLNSSSNQNYVSVKFSCLMYDFQCTYIERTKPMIQNLQYYNVRATSKDSCQSVHWPTT